ncbi:hypothetical protein BVRB_1g013340 [Beta vulgaris subsp. vulgaris]|nr:hypothetical protein BVRB_1g013340 [Beta vulgaris subsp. vulgaris]
MTVQARIHADIDMVMIPHNYTEFIDDLSFYVKEKHSH